MLKALQALASALSWINDMRLTKEEYFNLIQNNPGLAPSVEVKIPVQVTRTQERSFIRPPAIKFTIFGDPVGKPRQTRSDKWKKRPCVMRYRSWADIARASVPKSVDLGLYREISFIAWIGFPKSYSKKRMALLFGSPHFEKPDVDNVAKSLLDALFPEDKNIWKFSGEKRWDDCGGARIEVELR